MPAILALLILPLLATALAAWSRSERLGHRVTLLGGIAHLAASLYCLLARHDPFPAGSWLAVDPLGAFFLVILSHTFVLVVLYAPGFLRRMEAPEYARSRRLFYPALNFYLLANTLVLIVQQFALLWVVMELTTFSLVPLMYFYRTKESLEAVWKYLFLVSVGLVFLFVGILFLGVSAHGVVDYAAFVVSRMTEAAPRLNPLWLKASFIFALVGLSAKIGLAPMHPGDIDATSNAPSPIAALMAGSLRGTAVLALLRFYQVVAPTGVRPFADRMLIIAGFLSMAVAAIYMWRSRNFKRMLAYSSVEHLGIIALGIGIGGVALFGALLHLLFNSFGKIALFFMAGNIHHRYGSCEIDRITGLTRRLPWSGFVWGFAFFYIVGTPPFGIFFSELYLLLGMIRGADWLPLTLLLALLMVIFIGMGRAAMRMLQSPDPAPQSIPASGERFELSHALSLYALAISAPLAILQPAVLFDALRGIVASFGGNP
ncbi:MAG: proton-conducting transporter membrane subunit [Terrimicrobiaceae bacterium]|nr:proton-conducting transporter membrane subunit [Terrimicrobiaceae bacterium]